MLVTRCKQTFLTACRAVCGGPQGRRAQLALPVVVHDQVHVLVLAGARLAVDVLEALGL